MASVMLILAPKEKAVGKETGKKKKGAVTDAGTGTIHEGVKGLVRRNRR